MSCVGEEARRRFSETLHGDVQLGVAVADGVTCIAGVRDGTRQRPRAARKHSRPVSSVGLSPPAASSATRCCSSPSAARTLPWSSSGWSQRVRSCRHSFRLSTGPPRRTHGVRGMGRRVRGSSRQAGRSGARRRTGLRRTVWRLSGTAHRPARAGLTAAETPAEISAVTTAPGRRRTVRDLEAKRAERGFCDPLVLLVAAAGDAGATDDLARPPGGAVLGLQPARRHPLTMLVRLAKFRRRIERDYREREQALVLAPFEGRT